MGIEPSYEDSRGSGRQGDLTEAVFRCGEQIFELIGFMDLYVQTFQFLIHHE